MKYDRGALSRLETCDPICVPTLMFSKMVNAAALSASAVSVYGALGCPQCIWSNDHW